MLERNRVALSGFSSSVRNGGHSPGNTSYAVQCLSTDPNAEPMHCRPEQFWSPLCYVERSCDLLARFFFLLPPPSWGRSSLPRQLPRLRRRVTPATSMKTARPTLLASSPS